MQLGFGQVLQLLSFRCINFQLNKEIPSQPVEWQPSTSEHTNAIKVVGSYADFESSLNHEKHRENFGLKI